MWILKLAWKNLWRNRTRTLVTCAAVFFAVILSVITESLKAGIFDNLVKNVVSFYTGYIQVHKLGYQDDQILDNSMMQSAALEKSITGINNITGISPRLETFALASSSDLTKGCMITGISPENENKITRLSDKIISGKYLSEDDRAILLSEGFADRLNVKVNDTVIIIGQGYHGATAADKYPVKGILRFGSPQLNDKLLYIPLKTAQALFSAENMITSYVLSLRDDKQMNDASSKIKKIAGKDYEVMTWEELLPDIKQHIKTDTEDMKIIQYVLYLIIGFGIFSTMLMMLMERKFEMGMLVAIGMNKLKLNILLVTEAVMTVLIGCAAGIIASIPPVYYLKEYPIRLGGDAAKAYERFGFEAIFPTSTDSFIFLNQTITIFILALIISLYPVIRVIRLDPVKAMKK